MSTPDRVDLAAGLATALREPLGGLVEITDLQRLPGGASRSTWSCDAVRPDGSRVPLIFQQDRPSGARTGGGIPVEATLLRVARAAGVPVAEVVVTQDDPTVRGAAVALGPPWMVMRRIEGETVPRRIFREHTSVDGRAAILAQCGAALAAIHHIPSTDASRLESPDRLEQYRLLLDELGEPHPAFELGLRWLDAHRPPAAGQPCVVHGDFRTGNLIIGSDGLRAVLDWELAHLGDPLEDLGWFCVRAWRFGSPLVAGGFGSRQQLVEAYEEAGGTPVDPEALRWWEVMGTFTWGVICMMQAETHRSGLTRSVELAAIGRRVCETEHDLLVLLP